MNSITRALSAILLTACLPLGAYAQQGVTLDCRIEPFTQVEMSTAVEGVIAEVLVEKNDVVAAGDVLARLESGLEAATVDLRRVQAEVESDISSQQLALEFAERALKRVEDLYGQKVASFAELDKAKTEHALALQRLEQAKDRKRQAQLEHKRAQENLKRYTIVSPIDAVVTERYKEPGEHIDNEPILQLSQLNPLLVEVYAPANLFGKIHPGSRALVQPDIGPAQGYRVAVARVDRMIDGPSNTFGVRLEIANAEQSVPSGQRCSVTFPEV
ncbi:efflux RND transporter periplasmic adaptor subunit [Gilvimarinus sp. DA14]|uniref:efflux RND transporter periplasmic adaptor subunit n=1 Tax=Gilvimarinus sp. DA14 TaxID=2956798 RepID=UPI0020B79C3D|nr:efflux RND transporter periplasmic adaptor subunit [Gilvimarinus sp. DA14]UTF58939.1 efflux RND transporter periplasmic adaptor subunit [Gilvimarinus sp. DA14]